MQEQEGIPSNLSEIRNASDDAEEASDTPHWLNEQYLTEFLKENLENFAKILKFSIQPASRKGENYTSSVYRIGVDILLTDDTATSRSFIMKIPMPLEESATISSMTNLYAKEIAMYCEILPRFKKLYEQQGVITNLAPEFYKLPSATPAEAANSVILQDLAALNFGLQNRLEGLNMVHTENSLIKLAEFHAASARYVEVYGSYADMFNEHMFTEESRALYENAQMDYFLEYIKQYKGHEEYQDLIPSLLDKFVDICIAMGIPDAMEFNVLNHGDFWINNILFQHDDEGNLLDSRFVDFQLCKYASPTLDLYTFLLSGTQLDIKLKYFDYFVKFYHDHLTKNLKLLKYEGKIPTLRDLQGVMLKYGCTGFACLFYCLTICLLDPESDIEPNIDVFVDDSAESIRARDVLFLNDNFKAHAEEIMLWLARRGSLE